MLLETKGDYEFAESLNQNLSGIAAALSNNAKILKEQAKPATVWVYTEFNDGNAYGEQLIKVFATQEAARNYLRASVERCFGKSFADVSREFGNDGDDTVTPDYVAVANGDDVIFWQIIARYVGKGTEASNA